MSLRTWLVGFGVVVLWASAFSGIRVAAPELGAVGLTIVRMAIASAVLLALAPVLRVRVPARRDWPLVLGCGFLMALYPVLLNWGELSVPAATASMIVAAAPLISIAIAARIFGERLTALKILGSIVAIAGVAIVSLARGDFSFSAAVWILIASTVVQGAYHPLSKPLLARYSAVEVATYALVTGTVLLIPALPFTLERIATASVEAWWAAAYLGLFPSALGFVLWGYAVGRLPMAASTALLYLVPLVAVIVAFVWLGEVPYAGELVGGGVVLAGVAVVTLGDRLRARVRLMRDAFV